MRSSLTFSSRRWSGIRQTRPSLSNSICRNTSPPSSGSPLNKMERAMEYLAQLSKEGRRTLISFPDCPGCQTFADRRDEVDALAREALEGWLEAHLVTGDVPPVPSPRPRRRRKARRESRRVPIDP